MTQIEKRAQAKKRHAERQERAAAFAAALVNHTNSVAGSAALGKVGRDHHLKTYDGLCWFVLDHAGQNINVLEDMLHVWRKSTSLVGEAKRLAKISLLRAVTLILDNEYKVTLTEKTNGDLTALSIEPVREVDIDDAAEKALRAVRSKFPDVILKAAFAVIIAEERNPVTTAAKARVIAGQRKALGDKQAMELAAGQLKLIKRPIAV